MLLLEVLLETAGGSAGFSAHLGIEEVIASLESALKEAAGIMTYTTGKIIGRNVGGYTARRSQTDRKATGQVEKYFRHEITCIADCALAIGFRLFDKVVIGFLKQILKKDQMLEISHR